MSVPQPADAGTVQGAPRPGPFRRWALAHPRGLDIILCTLEPLFWLLTTGMIALSALITDSATDPADPSQAPSVGQTGASVEVSSLSESVGLPTARDVVVLLVVLAVKTAALLLWRRRRPVWFLIATLAAMTLSGLVVSTGDNGAWTVFIALYAVASRIGPRAGWIGFGVTVVVQGALLLEYSRSSLTDPLLPSELGIVGLTYLVLFLICLHLANRRRYVGALAERAELLAVERDQRAQLAAEAERSRIAREMHDVVAHSLTVIVALADGAAVTTERDGPAARLAMEKVSETGRHAIADMRRIFDVLRSDTPSAADDAESWHPQPSLQDLDTLVETFRQAGLPVHLSREGSIPADPALGLAIYRIVQESLTNVMRYGAGATVVAARVRRLPNEPASGEGDGQPAGPQIEITVTDNAMTWDKTAQSAWAGGGQGIVGMRQRAAVFGGQLEAGPRPEGGWRVHVVLELAEPEEES